MKETTMLPTRKIAALAAIALGGALAIPFAVRAQDDTRDDPRQDDARRDDVRAEMRVRDGRVHVKLHLADGRTVEKELAADELYRRLLGDDRDGRSPAERHRTHRAEREKRTVELKGRVAQLHRRRDGDDGDDDDVIDSIEKTLRSLPKKLENAFDKVREDMDQEKVRDIQDRIERTVHDALDALGGRRDRVRVEVNGRQMTVPARKGRATLY